MIQFTLQSEQVVNLGGRVHLCKQYLVKTTFPSPSHFPRSLMNRSCPPQEFV